MNHSPMAFSIRPAKRRREISRWRRRSKFVIPGICIFNGPSSNGAHPEFINHPEKLCSPARSELYQHSESLTRHVRASRGHPRLRKPCKIKGVDGTGTRACPSSAPLNAASRVNPTCDDEPGHDDVDG